MDQIRNPRDENAAESAGDQNSVGHRGRGFDIDAGEAKISNSGNKPGLVFGRELGLGLGAERIGAIAIANPKRWLGLLVLISLIALVGLSRINVDDSLTELFRSNTPEFAKYEALSERFPASEYDVLVVVEHDDLLTPQRIEKLRGLVA